MRPVEKYENIERKNSLGKRKLRSVQRLFILNLRLG